MPLKILQTCFSQSWGGLEIQALEVSKQLVGRGHHVWLACQDASRLHQEATAQKIVVLPLRIRGHLSPSIVWKLRAFLIEQQPDIVHCQLSRDIATVVPAVTLSSRHPPIVLSKRVGSFITKKDPLHRFTYRRLSRVLAISSVIQKNVIETTPVPPERVITLHDAVDTRVFSPQRVDRQNVRREFGYGDDTVLIGFVGRFSPGKGHEELLAAADGIRKKRLDVRFLVAGEASYGERAYEQHIRRSAHALGLDSIMTFAGFRRDVPALMAAFDILAFPSHAESFGVVLIEAMAMERAVVSTNCDGVLDIVVDGVTGLYVHPRNPDELANALLRLIDDPALRTSMGKAGRKRVLELFDQQHQIDRLERLYREVLHESATGKPPATGPGPVTPPSGEHPS